MKFLITLVLSIICGAAYSAPMSEDISICYKVIKKSSCIVSSGYGAVGSYTSIEQGKTTYLIETEMRVQSKHSLWMESQKQRLYRGGSGNLNNTYK